MPEEHRALKKQRNFHRAEFWGWVFLSPLTLNHEAAMQSRL